MTLRYTRRMGAILMQEFVRGCRYLENELEGA